MAVALNLKPLSPVSSCLTLPIVGVIGRDFTGTGRVSAVTIRVSALTYNEHKIIFYHTIFAKFFINLPCLKLWEMW